MQKAMFSEDSVSEIAYLRKKVYPECLISRVQFLHFCSIGKSVKQLRCIIVFQNKIDCLMGIYCFLMMKRALD